MTRVSIFSDENHYVQALAAFHSNSDQRQIETNWWKTKMPDIIARTSSTEPFRVLAVGTGDGKPYDEELLNMLCTSQKHVVYTVVEPSKLLVKGFQELVKNRFSPVEFRWFCMTWQDFQDKEWKKADGSQYNLIHFVHCVYFLSVTVEQLLERIIRCHVEMLCAGGAIVIYSRNHKGKTGFTPFAGLIWLDWKYNPFLKLTSEQGWKLEADDESHQIDLTKCFDEDSVEGNLLLDFITRTNHYRLTALEGEMLATLNYLREQTEDETMIAYPCFTDITRIWKGL